LEYKFPEPYICSLIFLQPRSGNNLYVEHQARDYGKSGYGIKKTVNHLLSLMTVYTEKSPSLRKKTWLFFVCSACFFTMLIYSLRLNFIVSAPEQHALYFSLAFFTAGCGVFSALVALKFWHRLLHRRKRQPQYIIREVVGVSE